MTLSAFEETYADYRAPQALHARRNGAIAALAIGGVAIFILAITSIFASPKNGERLAAPEALQAEPLAEAAPATQKFTLRSPSAGTPAAPARTDSSFDLAAPEYSNLKKEFTTSPRERGGRDDILTIGEFVGRGPYLRIALQQATGEKLNADFFLDMSRFAAQAGLAAFRVAPPTPLATRLGTFEAADIHLTQSQLEAPAAQSAVDRSCFAFRLVYQKLAVEAAGLACGAATAPIDKRALGCILDQLDYAPDSGHAALDQFFGKAAALERPQACASTRAQAEASKAASTEGRAKAAGLRRSTPRR